jgi:hypothetical protein
VPVFQAAYQLPARDICLEVEGRGTKGPALRQVLERIAEMLSTYRSAVRKLSALTWWRKKAGDSRGDGWKAWRSSKMLECVRHVDNIDNV